MPYQPRNKEMERPLCGCGTPAMERGKTVLGFTIWKRTCSTCQKQSQKYRKDECDKCGAKKELEIDHIDRDRSNNEPNNLQTLCRPCHNIKTIQNEEWKAYENL